MSRTLMAAPSRATPAVSSALQVVVAGNRSEVEALRPLWQEIQNRNEFLTMDADPDFFLGIYESLGSHVSPYVAAFGTRALLVGRMTTTTLGSRIGYLKAPCPALRCLEIVHGGLIIDGSASASSAVLDHLRSLLNNRVADLIEVQHLDAAHGVMGELSNGSVSTLMTVEQQPHLTLELIDSASGERIRRHSSKTRSTLRREDKRLQSHFDGDLKLTLTVSTDDVDAFIRDADSINCKSYHRGLEAGVCNDLKWRAIINTLARCNALRGYCLVGAGRPIAYMLGAKFDHACTLMATGYDPAFRLLSPGKVLMNRVLDSLAEEQTHTVDFGWGEAEYKNVLTSHRRDDVTIRLFSKGLRARLAYAIVRTTDGIANRLKTLAGGSRVQSWRRKWRQRMQHANHDS